MMTKYELKSLDAVGYGGYASALRQAQDAADAVTLPGSSRRRGRSETACVGFGGTYWPRKKITVVAGVVGVGKSMLGCV